jgi:hypothetical protein
MPEGGGTSQHVFPPHLGLKKKRLKLKQVLGRANCLLCFHCNLYLIGKKEKKFSIFRHPSNIQTISGFTAGTTDGEEV